LDLQDAAHWQCRIFVSRGLHLSCSEIAEAILPQFILQLEEMRASVFEDMLLSGGTHQWTG
jgi:hypothetical protein